MQAFDASSMIHAWDNYPIDQIPGVWKWIETEIKAGNFVIPQVAFEEVNHKAPDCGDWLKRAGITRISIGGDILTEAVRIKSLIGIQGDKYNPKGVDENDLIIIACARRHGMRVVSNEGIQHRLPDNMSRYKIPAVCNLKGVTTPCLNFIQLFKESGTVV